MERLTIPDKKIPGGTRRTIIDARAVREEAMTIYWALKKYEDTGLTPEEIKALNANGKTSEHRWIPVEERLPEESLNSVIGWDKYRERCCFVQYYAGSWHLGDESVRIIAWMPLPEPYRKEE